MNVDAFLNALMAIGLLLVLILIIYLIDRVNAIENETRRVMSTITESSVKSESPFMGLSAKKLWDVMCGRGTEGLDHQALSDLRGRYPLILSKHAEALYRDGYQDGFRGAPSEPQNIKLISTAKGSVESWIPSAQANALYQCGFDASQSPESDWGPIRASMDEAGHFLWSKAQIEDTSPLSEWLMPVATEIASEQSSLGSSSSVDAESKGNSKRKS